MTVAATRADALAAIHAQFAHDALYTDAANPVPVPLTVCWHGQNVHPIGDLGGGGYAEILERVDRLGFLKSELSAALDGGGLVPVRNGTVTFPGLGDSAFALDTQEPARGPVRVFWHVTPVGVVVP